MAFRRRDYDEVGYEEDEPQTLVSAHTLIEDLGNRRPAERQRTRLQLLEMAREATPALEQALLADSRTHVRWEAARLLGEIRDPGSTVALVSALNDRHPGVQWMATRALVALAPHSIVPLLRALQVNSGSVQVRNGAHFVLRSLKDEDLRARTAMVLVALEGMAPELTAPLAARAVLESLPLSDAA